jgi:hypothetical protein
MKFYSSTKQTHLSKYDKHSHLLYTLQHPIHSLGRFSPAFLGMMCLIEPLASANDEINQPSDDAAAAATDSVLAGASSAQKVELPVRVSRAFFQEQALLGRISAQTPNKKIQMEFDSSVRWEEEPTTQSAPQPGALADFRDHQGCAQYVTQNGVAVCFNMMGDVYSLGVNSKDVQLRGVADYINQKLNDSSDQCTYQVENLRFAKAERDSSQVTLHYTGEATSSECQGSAVNVAVQLKHL